MKTLTKEEILDKICKENMSNVHNMKPTKEMVLQAMQSYSDQENARLTAINKKQAEYLAYLKRAIHSESIIDNITAGARDIFESELSTLKDQSIDPESDIPKHPTSWRDFTMTDKIESLSQEEGERVIYLITEKNTDGTLKGCKPTIQVKAYWMAEGYKYTAHKTEDAITLCKWPIQDLGEHCCYSEFVIPFKVTPSKGNMTEDKIEPQEERIPDAGKTINEPKQTAEEILEQVFKKCHIKNVSVRFKSCMLTALEEYAGQCETESCKKCALHKPQSQPEISVTDKDIQNAASDYVGYDEDKDTLPIRYLSREQYAIKAYQEGAKDMRDNKIYISPKK